MNEYDKRGSRRVTPQAGRPVMVFDGDCRFCRYWILRLRGATGGCVDYEPFQKVAGDYPEIPRREFEGAVQLIEPDGTVTTGADAMFRALKISGRETRLLDALLAVPGFAAASRCIYRIIASHRASASLLTRLLFGASEKRPTYLFGRWLFIRLLGFVFLIAFISLLVQIRGLVGSHGILPAVDFFDAVRRQTGVERYWLLPSLCWINAGDSFLVFLCGAGAAVACLLILGFSPGGSLVVLWALYLSLMTAGQTFLGFQWDALLLEAGFLAIFLTPLQLWPNWKIESRASRLARWLMGWLLFRLMFESGVVKLASGDETWRHLTALTYHYETQPLPVWTSWYANQLPLWFHKLSGKLLTGTTMWTILSPKKRRADAPGLLPIDHQSLLQKIKGSPSKLENTTPGGPATT